MAIAQRQVPRIYQRPAARPAGSVHARPAGRARRRASIRLRSEPLAAYAGLALALILYVAGYARLTAVNYQRVKINRQIGKLEAREQLLRSEVLRLKQRDVVAAWASANGFVRAEAAPMFVRAAAEGE